MLSLREWPKVGRGAAKKQIKKNFLNFLVNISKLFKCAITEKEASLYLIHVKTIHLNIVNILYGIIILVQSEQSKQQQRMKFAPNQQ